MSWHVRYSVVLLYLNEHCFYCSHLGVTPSIAFRGWGRGRVEGGKDREWGGGEGGWRLEGVGRNFVCSCRLCKFTHTHTHTHTSCMQHTYSLSLFFSLSPFLPSDASPPSLCNKSITVIFIWLSCSPLKMQQYTRSASYLF